MGTYKGTTPTVRCRNVSGTNCNRRMPVDAEHCGNPEHVRLMPWEEPTGEGEFVRRALRRKPALTVNEDFDLIGHERDPEVDPAMPDLDPQTFDPSNLWVGTRVQQGFTAHHGTDAATAIRELRLLAGEALSKGRYERFESGFHRLVYQEFAVILSPERADPR